MMNTDLFKGVSFFSEPNSEGNKKQYDDLSDFKDPINPNQCFLEESIEKDYWVGQLSPTFSYSQFHSQFKDDIDNSEQIVNSSPLSIHPQKVEIIALFRNPKKGSNNLSVIQEERKFFGMKQRKNFSGETAKILKDWLLENKENPYPTIDQLNSLCILTGLTSKQIRTYFVNNRSRLLNRSPKGGKIIKSKKLLKEEELQANHLNTNILLPLEFNTSEP